MVLLDKQLIRPLVRRWAQAYFKISCLIIILLAQEDFMKRMKEVSLLLYCLKVLLTNDEEA